MSVNGRGRLSASRIVLLGTATAGFLLACAGLLARRRLLIVDVVGDSMAPTYRPNDRRLVRRTRRFRTGYAVIAHHQQGGRRNPRSEPLATSWLVKRLAALPGDPVPEAVRPAVGGCRQVPMGMAVLLGEHAASADSRTWGFIALDEIEGVVVARLRASDPPSGVA